MSRLFPFPYRIHIINPERQDIAVIDRIHDGVGVEFVPEGLLGGLQVQIPARPRVLREDRCARKTEQVVLFEVPGDGGVHLTEIGPVAFIENYHHPLLEDRMVLVLLYEYGQFLYGGDNDTVVVITAALVLVLKLPLENGR